MPGAPVASGEDAVLVSVVGRSALRLVVEAQVLEVGGRLAVGHGTPAALDEELLGPPGDTRPADGVGGVGQLLEAVRVVVLDGLAAAGEVVERVAVRREHPGDAL